MNMNTKKKWIIGIVGCAVATGLIVGLAVGISGNRSGIYLDDSTPEALPVSLRMTAFDPSMLAGYDECSDYVIDLEEMSKYMVNVHIDRMALQYYHDQYFYDRRRNGNIRGPIWEDIAEAEDKTYKTSTKGGADKLNTGENSYGSNNQVEGVDEADSVKSDGAHVYAAYGDNLVVWDAIDGTEVSRTVIPTTDDDGTPLCNDDSTSTERCYENYEWQKVTIASLLMYDNRITAIVQSPYDIRGQNQSTMYGSHATRLFVYKKFSPDDNGPLTLIAQKDINGIYQSARSIGEYAHIVTSSSVNAWKHLYEHLHPKKFFPKSRRLKSSYNDVHFINDVTDHMTENQYRNAARAKAEELISSFAQQLAIESLDTTDFSSADCTKIAHLALYSKQNNNTDGEENARASFTTISALSNFAQVISFDILAATDDSTFPTSSSGIFIPLNSYSSSVYSSRDKLIIAGKGYEENSEGNWEEKTLLFAFNLDKDTSKAESIGVVPGSLLNQFSMDHYSDGDEGTDYLRVATTSWGRWGIVDGNWEQTEESSSQVTVLTLPPLSNQTDDPTNMEIVGQASNLGKGERIYAVRFLGTRAFVVTFRQIDPFYTLDMTDPANPKVVGELKIPGFSNYLHPIGDGNLILAVGQDADEEGRVNGLQIAMYDVTDFANPTQVKKFSENTSDDYSSSAAQYDHQAFRYLPETEALILPVQQYGETMFDGFVVYDVPVQTDQRFGVSFKISHVDKNMQRCWSRSSLTARSMVFNGHVTTLKGHTVLSHDLSDKDRQWLLNLDKDQDQAKDCAIWWH